MRAGLAVGDRAHLRVTVTRDMTAIVGDRQIHPAYGTVPLAGHVEQVCRGMLEPLLEDGEDGVGYRLEIVHRRPVPVGCEVTLTATVTDIGPGRLVCGVTVTGGDRVVAEATFEQRVVDAESFTRALRESCES